MINSRQKGKRIERYFKNQLKDIFPDIERNANEQSRDGGNDLQNTSIFSFECKGGKKWKLKAVKELIEQMSKQREDKYHYPVALVKPDRDEAYCVIPFKDFKSLLLELSSNDII